MHSLFAAWPGPRRSRLRRKVGIVDALIALISCSTAAIAQKPASRELMDNGNPMAQIAIRL